MTGKTYAYCHALTVLSVEGNLAQHDINWMDVPVSAIPKQTSPPAIPTEKTIDAQTASAEILAIKAQIIRLIWIFVVMMLAGCVLYLVIG